MLNRVSRVFAIQYCQDFARDSQSPNNALLKNHKFVMNCALGKVSRTAVPSDFELNRIKKCRAKDGLIFYCQ